MSTIVEAVTHYVPCNLDDSLRLAFGIVRPVSLVNRPDAFEPIDIDSLLSENLSEIDQILLDVCQASE